ncbi:DUF6531 domain-containing protein [Acidovorax sp. NCPPB 3576]|uniref:DUF6531 domain-containing protein n=1 Tax=Acidovorax sp. NCPPB 3576 TaxID=2940488 RepID=UPI00234BA29A|nr:DUF6531 domain-containing protein [Acidovorax sp. NCPPB 3576]WCM86287.1 DUF6531 domain-containing protein [Acidovorax sp. NCPPB 3576]
MRFLEKLMLIFNSRLKSVRRYLLLTALFLFSPLCVAAAPPAPLWGPPGFHATPGEACEQSIIDANAWKPGWYESYELLPGSFSYQKVCMFYAPGHLYASEQEIAASCPYGWYPDGPFGHLRPSEDNASCVCPPGSPVYSPEYQVCISSFSISIDGPAATKVLPAGPALSMAATLKANGEPGRNWLVTVSVPGGLSINGKTDMNGKFKFTYIPPRRPMVARLTAACRDCNNVSTEMDINVTDVPICRADPGVLLGNPVAPVSGAKIQVETDWQDQSAHPLSLVRTYRSSGSQVPVGWGGYWSHNYSAQLVGGDFQRNAQFGNGTLALFTRNTKTDPWVNDSGEYRLEQNTDGWRITRLEDDAYWQFDGNNVLVKIGQRNGWVMTLSYAGGALTQVTNAFGRKLQFFYDTQGYLASVTAPNGQTIAYTLHGTGRPLGVLYPDNRSKSYLYENAQYPDLLTGINDESGRRYATFSYDADGRATSTSHAGGVLSYSVTYPEGNSADKGSLTTGSVDGALYQSSVQTTDPRGNVQTWNYQGGDGTVRTLGASGPFEGATVASRSFADGLNLPILETDFLGNKTTFEWDVSRRLLLKTTRAASTPLAQTTQTQWHPALHLPVMITEASRTTAYTYDPLGNKLSETITDAASNESRTVRWTYNDQGLVASMTDTRGKVWTYGYDIAGNTTKVTNPLGHVTLYSYSGAGQITQITDPNGVVTANTYDARQRLLSTSVAGQTTTYAYDAVGQLTRATRPDANWIGFEYDAAHRLAAVTDNLGNRIDYTLDNAGNRVAQQTKDPAGVLSRQITRMYDAVGRLQKTTGLE